MRIVRVTLHDFRAFPGSFDLPLKDGCNLLLHGENGSGKSSLATALREFLSLERGFPRPVQQFEHVFPDLTAPLDPATGKPPERIPKVSLKFADPDEEFAWEPGKLHPLQLNDGSAPPSTSEPQREALVAVSRQSGFFDYRALLRSTYRRDAPDLGAQLFSLFVESLLGGFRPDGGAKTLRELWSETKAAKPATRYARTMRRANSVARQFNGVLSPYLAQLRKLANRFLRYFTGCQMGIVRLAHSGCQFSKSNKELIGDRIELSIKFARRRIDAHDEFLNEARLTALGLALFLAAVRLADSNPADPNPLRVLLLDDVLIGLDLSHRLPLLDLLRREFINHQILLFTHDSVWFDIAKGHTEHWGNWRPMSIYAEVAGKGEPDVPRLKGHRDDVSMKELDVAQRHLDSDDLRAAAVYVRAAFEEHLRKLCKGVAVPYNPNPLEIKANDLWAALLGRHKERRAKSNKQYMEDALLPKVDAMRSAVLNRLAHTGPPTLTKPDVQDALNTVRAFKSMRIPFDPDNAPKAAPVPAP